jgi:hypothetical protein
MQHTTRWQWLGERLVISSVLLTLIKVPIMCAVYQFGAALGEPMVG